MLSCVLASHPVSQGGHAPRRAPCDSWRSRLGDAESQDGISTTLLSHRGYRPWAQSTPPRGIAGKWGVYPVSPTTPDCAGATLPHPRPTVSLGAITARLSGELLPRIHPGVRTAKWGHATYGWLSADPVRCEPSNNGPWVLRAHVVALLFGAALSRCCDDDGRLYMTGTPQSTSKHIPKHPLEHERRRRCAAPRYLCPVLSCPVLSCTVLYCTVLYMSEFNRLATLGYISL